MLGPSANVWVLLGLGLAGIVLIKRRFKKATREDLGAFIERVQLLPPPQPAPPKAPHPLTGLSFAVADIFDIVGYITGFGSPEWKRTHQNAIQTSSSVLALVEAGATCIGKTVINELGFSLRGENKHYETPVNPVFPARTAGGSSSGSAVAVASKLVDFSLGIDTSGGVRVPGACCGILGFRASHGIISNTGVIPVSPSLDTIGWFANDPAILRRVGHVLLGLPSGPSVGLRPKRIIIADDCFLSFKGSKKMVAEIVIRSLEKVFGKHAPDHVDLGNYTISNISSLQLFNDNGLRQPPYLKLLANAMQALQWHEFQSHHGDWISLTNSVLDPVLLSKKKCQGTSGLTIDNCYLVRSEMRSGFDDLLKDCGILVLPTLAESPPMLGKKEFFSEYNSLGLLAFASMSGCCQVTVPLVHYEKYPVSVSFVARHGADCLLLDTVHTLYATLQEQVHVALKPNLARNRISKEASAEIAKEKGNSAFRQKQWQKAVSFYSEAIRLSGKSATYFSNRAAAYLELRSFGEAEEDSTVAINLDKKNVKAYLRRGTAREMLGLYSDAFKDFQYALVLEPTNKTAAEAVNRLKKLI